MTAAEVQVKRREFRLRQYVEGYTLRGERDNACDELSQSLIQNWIAGNYGGTINTNVPPLAELSYQLANDPACTDPLVLTVAAVNGVGLYEERDWLDRAVSGFEHSKHLGYPKFYATVCLAGTFVQLNTEPNRVKSLDALALQRFGEALADGSLRHEDQEDLGEILLDGWAGKFFKRNEAAVVAVVKNGGESFQWLALVLEGEHEINEAWRARGNGYANTVTAQGWQDFSHHLDRASDCLTRAWRLQPSLPLAPCRMMTVALGNSGLADMRLWFDRTTTAQVDFAAAWKNMRWGLRPRWFGNLDAMLAQGVTAINTGRFDTDVPRKFMDSVEDLELEEAMPAGTHIYGRDDIWPHIQDMYEGYVAAPAQLGARDGWRGAYATVAYLAGKYPVARQQLQAIHWQPAGDLSGWGVDLSLMPLEVAARTGAQSNEVAAAEADRTDGNVTRALKQYESLDNRSDLDDLTRSFVQDRLETLALEAGLQRHEWVNYLPTDTNLTGWHVERGDCRLNSDGSLEVHSGLNGHLLYSRARVGPDFEVRGQYEVERSTSKSFEGGLVMGLPQFASYNWYSFRIKRNGVDGDVSDFAKNWTVQRILTPVTLDNATNSFYFRFHNGKVSASVNQRQVFSEMTPAWKIDVAADGFYVGLGAFSDKNDTAIRYRGVQVRSLAGQ